MQRSVPHLAWGFLLVAVAMIAAACGGGDDRLADVSEVLDRLDETFIDQDKLDQEALNAAAIQGIIDYLDDPYTWYSSEELYQRFAEELEGEPEEFDGIGAEITIRNGKMVILGPLPGSPARNAGILPGDVIVEVDGQTAEGNSLDWIVSQIRGPKGTEVVLTVQRVGAARPFPVTVVRDTIVLTSVMDRIQAPGIGYIRLDAFDAKAAELLRAAIDRLRAEGTEGLILDLRDNRGGLVEAAVDVTSEFIAEGLVFRWQNADGSEQLFEVTGEGATYHLPLVVLANRSSASASEIFIGAIQDHERGVVVGTRTFGKGSVNIVSQLSSGAGLNVTTSRWLTPLGRLIEGVGLLPDVLIGQDVDFSSLQRLGDSMTALCEAFDEAGSALRDRASLHDALTALCVEGGEPPTPPGTDEILDTGIAELRKLLGA